MSGAQFIIYVAVWFVLGGVAGFIVGRESVRREQKRSSRPITPRPPAGTYTYRVTWLDKDGNEVQHTETEP
jgi:hypothetical protein